ncbi:unnamed protein product, partial [marine sediment metagenome]
LANDLSTSFKDAGEFIDNYFRLYPEVKQYMESVTEYLKEYGRVPIIHGLTRHFKNYNSANNMLKKNLERAAINTPIQGIAAHIMKLAMIAVSDALKSAGLKSRLILQVHDELLLEAPEDELETVKSLVKERMENVVELSVPLVVDVGFAKNWGGAH